MEEGIPKPERIGAHPIFVFLYLLVFVGIVLYPGYVYGFNLMYYTLDNILSLFGYLVPAFLFALTGIMTLRRERSVVYAVCAAIVGLLIMVFVSQMGWWGF